MTRADCNAALQRARDHAPYLAGLLDRLPELADILAAGDVERALDWAKGAGRDIPDVGLALRREKQALALALAIGDLAGALPLLRVTGELSAFADRAMDAAIADAIRRRVPDAQPAGFLALALGKHGADELNYSSDIDPILLFDPEKLPRRASDDPGEAGARVARTLVETLARVNSEGYVFRVDLRLRPASEINPLAIPIDAALSHYESSALAWERAAFIRARACAGDVAAGEAFLAAIRPFIWRKSLDFGAIAEVGRLTASIRENFGKIAVPGPGFDLKRGRGGIREVEFYAQIHQLIYGGRNPSIRLRGTRASLNALAAAGIIPDVDAMLLGESYDRLRVIEHRLQMVADQQTHSLPQESGALDAVAWLDGMADGGALVEELMAITDAVGQRYDALIVAAELRSPEAITHPKRKPLAGQLAKLGFADPKVLAKRMAGWRTGGIAALRSDAALAAYDAIEPQVLCALAAAPDRDRALLRWEQLLANLPGVVNLFQLLEARPGLLDLLVRILSFAPPLADELARRYDLLDSLIDTSAFDLPGEVSEICAYFSAGEAEDDYQRILDRVRRRVSELRFVVGVQLIEGSTDPLAVSAALARIAEAAIAVLADATIAEFRRAHGVVAGSELVILGLGRMGGGALTHASDLDLVFVFTGIHIDESDGPKVLGATTYYNRLAQRVSAALSVPTAEGALYQVDTRLRPWGEQGLLSVSLDSFERYQRQEAWTWEHMALARCRVLYGSEPARSVLDGIVDSVLCAPRDPAKLHSDVIEMRATIKEHKPAKGPLDVKLARGGLVDLEFMVHYLQLRESKGLTPMLGDAVQQLVSAGLLPEPIIAAHDSLSRLLVATRLMAPDAEYPLPAARQQLAEACHCDDWEGLLAAQGIAQAEVSAAWQIVFGRQN